VVLFLSYLQKDKGELLHVRRAKELDKNKTVCLSSRAELPPLSAKSMP